MQGKLVRATPTGRTWQSQRGDVFETWDVMFDVQGRAVSGQANGKQGSDRLNRLVGKDVTFEVTPGGPRQDGGQWPDKIGKIAEVGGEYGPGKGGGKNYDTLGAQIGNALHCATLLACHGKIEVASIGGEVLKLVKVGDQVRAAVEAERAAQAQAQPQPQGTGTYSSPQTSAGNVGGQTPHPALDDEIPWQ